MAIPDDIEAERDRMYEDVRYRYDYLLHHYPTISSVEAQIAQWEQLLSETTDVSCRQIIKEGLNDCRALLNRLIKRKSIREHIRAESVRELSRYNPDDDVKNIFARADISWQYQRETRTVDGDVLMFFGNGDVYMY